MVLQESLGGRFQKSELEFTYLKLITVNQLMAFNAASVDVGAIEAIQVLNDESGGSPDNPCVMPGYGDIIQEEMVLRIATDCQEICI